MDITNMEIARTHKIENSLAGQNYYEDIKIITDSGNSVLCWVADDFEEANKESGRLAWVFDISEVKVDGEIVNLYNCRHITKSNTIGKTVFTYVYAKPLSQEEKQFLEVKKIPIWMEVSQIILGCLTASSFVFMIFTLVEKSPRLMLMAGVFFLIFGIPLYIITKYINKNKPNIMP